MTMGITFEEVMQHALELKEKLFYLMQCQNNNDMMIKLRMYELVDAVGWLEPQEPNAKPLKDGV